MLKEKRNGIIKARVYANGRKQRRYISKEEISFPTIQLESLVISLLIDEKKGRDVASVDVVEAYLLATMEDYVLLKLTGDTITMMCQINLKYLYCVTQQGNKKVLYMRLKKALYGYMQSAILWYNTLIF